MSSLPYFSHWPDKGTCGRFSIHNLSLARYYRHSLGVNFLSESIQRDAFFRNVFLDQEQ